VLEILGRGRSSGRNSSSGLQPGKDYFELVPGRTSLSQPGSTYLEEFDRVRDVGRVE